MLRESCCIRSSIGIRTIVSTVTIDITGGSGLVVEKIRTIAITAHHMLLSKISPKVLLGWFSFRATLLSEIFHLYTVWLVGLRSRMMEMRNFLNIAITLFAVLIVRGCICIVCRWMLGFEELLNTPSIYTERTW